MTTAEKRIRRAVARRKKWRDRARTRGNKRGTLREIRAIQRLRARLDHIHREPRVMFDDTDVDLIPKSARAVAGYTGGHWPTFASLARLFPKARRVSIAVNSGDRGQFLDIEPGDASVGDFGDWWRAHVHARGGYCAESDAAALVAAAHAHGIDQAHFVLWTAHIGHGRHICGPKTCGCPVQADATQWTWTSNGRSLDESYLHPSFWLKKTKH